MTTRRAAKAEEPAATETPGTAEPDAAVPGTSQDAPEPVHEPALDEAAEAAPADSEAGTEAEAAVPPAFTGRLTIDQVILNRYTHWRYLAIPSLPPRQPTAEELAVYAARLDAPEWAGLYRATPPLLLGGPQHRQI